MAKNDEQEIKMKKYKVNLIVKSAIKDEDDFRSMLFDVLDGRIKPKLTHIYDSYEEGITSSQIKEKVWSWRLVKKGRGFALKG